MTDPVPTTPPKIDGRYEIVKSLGGGLSGEVHLVADEEGQKALKFLKKVQMGVSREDALQNFKNEFAILKELNHPNIARILDFGFDTRTEKYYFTTEFVCGRELHTACEGQPFEVLERLIVQVLRALNYLHSRGIYHFDIKPQNVLVGLHEGQPDHAKIIDFGLAGYSTPRKKVGTPAYMAPEVIQGGPLDGRTDLYSTGVLIYRLFTGQNPFASKSLKETLDKQLQLIPPPPSSINSAVPPYWDHVVARLLEKNPAQRYSQASLVIRDLNFLSQNTFEIETRDTKISYLPEKGTLIGREESWHVFTELFEKMFESDHPGDIRLLCISGEQGTGKSRMLSEIKYFSQLRNVPVKTLKQFQSEPRPAKFIITVDEADHATPDMINSLLQELGEATCVVVWSVTQAPRGWENTRIVRLANYDRAQLKLYLESVTGFDQAPDFLIDEVFRRTLGNPLFVTEFVKSLLDSNLLFDEAGKWDAKTFDDIKIDFSKITIPSTIEECIVQRLNQLDDSAYDVVTWLAVNRAPLRLDELCALTNSGELPQILLKLIEQDVLEKTSREAHYFFANVLYADVHYRDIPPENLAQYHQRLAELYAADPEKRKQHLYHLGHGTDGDAGNAALMGLAKEHFSETNYAAAVEILQGLLPRLPQTGIEMLVATELLANSYYEAIRYEEAFSAYRSALQLLPDVVANADVRRCLHLLGRMADVCNKLERLDEVDTWTQTALAAAHAAQDRAHELLITNIQAHAQMKRGHIAEARSVFERTQSEWCELSEKDQAIVNNNRLIDIYHLLKDYKHAILFCEQGIAVYQRLGLKTQLARTYYALGSTYYRMLSETGLDVEQPEIFEKCLVALHQSEKLGRDINDNKLLAVIHNGFANVYVHQKCYEEALASYARAMTIARSIGNIANAAMVSMNCGNIYKMLHKYHDAYSHLIYAINSLENLAEKSTSEWMCLYQAYLELAQCHWYLEQPAHCHEMVAKAQQVRENNSFLKDYEFWEHLEYARAYKAEGKMEEAHAQLELARQTTVTGLDQDEFKKLETEFKGDVKTSHDEEVKPVFGYRIMKETNEASAPASGREDLRTIIQINRIINGEHEVAPLLKMVLTYALELTRAEAGFVLLLSEDGSFEVKASLNAKESDEEKISMSIAKAAIETGEIINSADALSDDRFDTSESVVLNELKSVLCLPIRSKNKSVGVFYLDNRYRVNAFAECNVSLINAFCDQVGIALENARLISDLTAAKQQLQERLDVATQELAETKAILKEESETYKTRYTYKNIISASQPMQDIFKLLDKVTETNLTVFIHGESGTGKELVAKALHYNNPPRMAKRFVAINCGAIPANLMESEMFGHKAGSFTGATGDKKGLFEEATGGTIFFDEIGELDPLLQVKLLRVLQEGEVQRIGDSRSIKVDARVVCASHRNLQDMVKQGKFREDLFYRLCQMKIDLPPLRERCEDIPPLAKHFVEKFRKQNNLTAGIDIPPAFMKALVEYNWPGNIRELENLVSVACALREGNTLSLASLPPNYAIARAGISAQFVTGNLANMGGVQILIDGQNVYDPQKTWDEYEGIIIAKCYLSLGRKKITAAEALGLSHSTLYKKVADLALDDDSNPIYADAFEYAEGRTLKDYVALVFEAALKFHEKHPYAAIRQLKVSQGYFYKIMKTFQPAQQPEVA